MALKCIKIMYDGDSVNNMVRLSYLIASLKETLLADNMPFFFLVTTLHLQKPNHAAPALALKRASG